MNRCERRNSGFTLVEMIVATVVAAMLTAAVLAAVAGIGRDRRRMNAEAAVNVSPQWLDLLRRDLINSSVMMTSDGGGVALEGNGGVDAKTLVPNNRLARITYRVRRNDDDTTTLLREQRYLDDPVRPEPWSEIVALGVTRITLTPASADFEIVRERRAGAGGRQVNPTGALQPMKLKIPTRVKVHLDTVAATTPGAGIDQELWVK